MTNWARAELLDYEDDQVEVIEGPAETIAGRAGAYIQARLQDDEAGAVRFEPIPVVE